MAPFNRRDKNLLTCFVFAQSPETPTRTADDRGRRSVPAACKMTSFFVPPTQPSVASHSDSEAQFFGQSIPATNSPSVHPFDAQHSPNPFLSPVAPPAHPPRTIVLDPPQFTPSATCHPVTHVSIHGRYLAITSKFTLTVFELHLVPPDPQNPPFTVLAQWSCPHDFCIAAMDLSPDASVIAIVIHRPRSSSALVLLRAENCARLIRLALPAHLSFSVESHRLHCPLSFVTSSTTTVASSVPPATALPSRLQRILAIHHTASASPSSSLPVRPPAQWSLIVSSNVPTDQVFLIAFHKGYRRVHHQTHLTIPRTTDLPVVHSVPQFPAARGMALTLATPHLAFRLVNTSFDQLVAIADIPMHSLIGMINSHVVVALCERANNSLAIAVVDEPTLTITSTPFRVSEVRTAALLTPPQGDDIVVIVPTDGFPRVAAHLSFSSHSRAAGIHLAQPSKEEQSQNGLEARCPIETPAAVSMIQNLIVAVYADDDRVFVRVTDYDECLSESR